MITPSKTNNSKYTLAFHHQGVSDYPHFLIQYRLFLFKFKSISSPQFLENLTGENYRLWNYPALLAVLHGAYGRHRVLHHKIPLRVVIFIKDWEGCFIDKFAGTMEHSNQILNPWSQCIQIIKCVKVGTSFLRGPHGLSDCLGGLFSPPYFLPNYFCPWQGGWRGYLT